MTSRDEDGTGAATRDQSSANATLATLESALADATAITMWSAARESTLRIAHANAALGTENSPAIDYAPINGFASVVERVLVGHISVSVFICVVGLADIECPSSTSRF